MVLLQCSVHLRRWQKLLQINEQTAVTVFTWTGGLKNVPYNNRQQLPDAVKSALAQVPHAQSIYKEAFNSAMDQYNDESRAHAVAWSAVKDKYAKGDDKKWHKK